MPRSYRRSALLTLPLVLALTGCAVMGRQLKQVPPDSRIYFEPSIPRSEVRIARVAIVPNRLPLNLTDAEEWRQFNWEEITRLFRRHGYEVVDYETTVSAFERSGLPLEDTQTSRDKYAEFASELAVDAVIIPYYGTLFNSQMVLFLSNMEWTSIATFQIYLTQSNDFFARIDASGTTKWVSGAGPLMIMVASMMTTTRTVMETQYISGMPIQVPVEENVPGAEEVQTLYYAMGVGFLLADLVVTLMGPKAMWRASFRKGIRKGLEPFFTAFPTPERN